MNKKVIFLIMVIVLLIIIMLYLNVINKNDKEETNSEITTSYNNETKNYEILNNNEIIKEFKFEEDSQVYYDFYKENPTYNANPPVSSNSNETYQEQTNYND